MKVLSDLCSTLLGFSQIALTVIKTIYRSAAHLLRDLDRTKIVVSTQFKKTKKVPCCGSKRNKRYDSTGLLSDK